MKKRTAKIRNLCLTALFAALLSVSALVAIPLAVPITLQTLVLFSSMFILGGRRTSVSVLLYIIIGAVGVPVFSGFSGGVARLLDATGGYIFGMLLAAFTYWLLELLLPRAGAFSLISVSISLLIIYAAGTLWYAFVYAGGAESLGAVFTVCVLPFILPDTVKLALAYVIAKRMPKLV